MCSSDLQSKEFHHIFWESYQSVGRYLPVGRLAYYDVYGESLPIVASEKLLEYSAVSSGTKRIVDYHSRAVAVEYLFYNKIHASSAVVVYEVVAVGSVFGQSILFQSIVERLAFVGGKVEYLLVYRRTASQAFLGIGKPSFYSEWWLKPTVPCACAR